MIKKTILIGLLLCGFSVTSRAALFTAGSANDRVVTVVSSATVAALTTSTYTILVDLSDTTNWPHKKTREINIVGLKVFVDKVAASTGSVKIGVMNMVNASTGSVTWFYNQSWIKNVSNTGNHNFMDYSFSPIKTRVEGGLAGTDGTTPYLLSNDKISQSTVFQTDVNLPTLVGQSPPGRGDIIVQYQNPDAANTIFVYIEMQYYTPETE